MENINRQNELSQEDSILDFRTQNIDKEYFEAIKNNDMDKVRKLVSLYAEQQGYTDAIPEHTDTYIIRNKTEPRKTIKAYKCFFVDEYGRPSALFVGGADTLPQNVWVQAKDVFHFKSPDNENEYVPTLKNPNSAGGKTGDEHTFPEEAREYLIEHGFISRKYKGNKVTCVAYRPGWHAGTEPISPQLGILNPEYSEDKKSTEYKCIHRYNQVIFEVELDATTDYTDFARNQDKAKTKKGKINPKKADLQHIPEDGFYRYATNQYLYQHPELGEWMISSSMKIIRALSQEECDQICKQHGIPVQKWENGLMDLQTLGYDGPEFDAAKKTLAPITYDENGDIIPLSKRFDKTNPSVLHDLHYTPQKIVKETIPGITRSAFEFDEKYGEKEQTEEKEARLNCIQNILSNPDLACIKLKTNLYEGHYVLIHKSSRYNDPNSEPGIKYQISWFDDKGAIMHQNAKDAAEVYEKINSNIGWNPIEAEILSYDFEKEKELIKANVLEDTLSHTVQEERNKENHKVYETNGLKVDISPDGKITPEGWRNLAEIMDMYSNKSYETTRYLFIKDGKIIRHTAISCRIPNTTIVDDSDSKKITEYRHYAEENDCQIIMVHNHPSGDIRPSNADIRENEILMEELKDSTGKSRLMGCVTLDHGNMGIFNAQDRNWYTTMSGKFYNGFDNFESLLFSKNFEINSKPIIREEEKNIAKTLASLAKELDNGNNWNNSDWIPLFFLNEKNEIKKHEYINKSELANIDDLKRKLKDLGTEYSSTKLYMLPATYDNNILCQVFNQKTSMVTDIYCSEPGYTNNYTLNNNKNRIFTDEDLIISEQEDSLDYPFVENIHFKDKVQKNLNNTYSTKKEINMKNVYYNDQIVTPKDLTPEQDLQRANYFNQIKFKDTVGTNSEYNNINSKYFDFFNHEDERLIFLKAAHDLGNKTTDLYGNQRIVEQYLCYKFNLPLIYENGEVIHRTQEELDQYKEISDFINFAAFDITVGNIESLKAKGIETPQLLFEKINHILNKKEQSIEQADKKQNIDLSKVIVFDTETTGFKAGDDELLQISIADGNGKTIFNSYVKPERKTSWKEAMKINGISPAMVKNAPTVKELVPELQKIFDDAEMFMSYNGRFDTNFLKAAGLNIPEETPHLDVIKPSATITKFPMTSKSDKRSIDGYHYPKLTDIAGYYGIEYKAHDSMGDTLATLQVAKNIYGENLERLSTEDLQKYTIDEKKSETINHKLEKSDVTKLGYMIREFYPEIIEEIKQSSGNKKMKDLIYQLEENPAVKGVKVPLNILLGRYAEKNHPELIPELSKLQEKKAEKKSINGNYQIIKDYLSFSQQKNADAIINFFELNKPDSALAESVYRHFQEGLNTPDVLKLAIYDSMGIAYEKGDSITTIPYEKNPMAAFLIEHYVSDLLSSNNSGNVILRNEQEKIEITNFNKLKEYIESNPTSYEKTSWMESGFNVNQEELENVINYDTIANEPFNLEINRNNNEIILTEPSYDYKILETSALKEDGTEKTKQDLIQELDAMAQESTYEFCRQSGKLTTQIATEIIDKELPVKNEEKNKAFNNRIEKVKKFIKEKALKLAENKKLMAAAVCFATTLTIGAAKLNANENNYLNEALNNSGIIENVMENPDYNSETNSISKSLSKKLQTLKGTLQISLSEYPEYKGKTFTNGVVLEDGTHLRGMTSDMGLTYVAYNETTTNNEAKAVILLVMDDGSLVNTGGRIFGMNTLGTNQLLNASDRAKFSEQLLGNSIANNITINDTTFTIEDENQQQQAVNETITENFEEKVQENTPAPDESINEETINNNISDSNNTSITIEDENHQQQAVNESTTENINSPQQEVKPENDVSNENSYLNETLNKPGIVENVMENPDYNSETNSISKSLSQKLQTLRGIPQVSLSEYPEYKGKTFTNGVILEDGTHLRGMTNDIGITYVAYNETTSNGTAKAVILRVMDDGTLQNTHGRIMGMNDWGTNQLLNASNRAKFSEQLLENSVSDNITINNTAFTIKDENQQQQVVNEGTTENIKSPQQEEKPETSIENLATVHNPEQPENDASNENNTLPKNSRIDIDFKKDEELPKEIGDSDENPNNRFEPQTEKIEPHTEKILSENDLSTQKQTIDILNKIIDEPSIMPSKPKSVSNLNPITFLQEALKLNSKEDYKQFYDTFFNFEKGVIADIPPIADNTVGLFIGDNKEPVKTIKGTNANRKALVESTIEDNISLFCPTPEQVMEEGLETSIGNALKQYEFYLSKPLMPVREQNQEVSNSEGQTPLKTSLPDWWEQITDSEVRKLYNMDNLGLIIDFVKDPYMVGSKLPPLSSAKTIDGITVLNQENDWTFDRKNPSDSSVIITRMNNGIREFKKLDSTYYEQLIRENKNYLNSLNTNLSLKQHLEATYNYEDKLQINQEKQRSNTAAQFWHNFKVLCKGEDSSGLRNEAGNINEAVQIANELYSRMSPEEKKKLKRMEKDFKKQTGLSFQEHIENKYNEIFRNREIINFDVYDKSSLSQNTFKSQKSLDDDHSLPVDLNMRIGDSVMLGITARDIKGKKINFPAAEMEIKNVSKNTNTIVLYDKQKKARFDLPLDTFVSHQREVNKNLSKQNKKLQKHNLKLSKAKYGEGISL